MGKGRCGKTMLLAAVLLGGCDAGQQLLPPPETRVEMLEETLHGVTVADPYRWLEDESSPETERWVDEQSAYSRTLLDALPGRADVRQRLTEVLGTGSLTRPEEAAGRYFYSKKQGGQNQPVVYARDGVDGKDRVLIDPNELSKDGTVTVDWFLPSRDGRLLTYGMSSGGTETSDLHNLEVDSGETVGEPIPKVRWANPQWLKDGSGFYYTRPRELEGIGPGEEVYHRRVFYHQLGATWPEDKLIYGEELKKEEMPYAILSPDERYLLIDVSMGWGKKQNVFDDFIAAAEFLVERQYVDPKRLAIHGRSNGGLLVGAAMTQRPDLFRAVICGVPLLDMVRYHRFRMARLWISEYGSAENPEDFLWLHAYSPYHRVKDGESYPPTLIYTGASDSRVDPLHARKMAARLQAANASKHPIVLRVETGAGHGRGKPLSKTVDEWTDIWSFTFDQLGVEYD